MDVVEVVHLVLSAGLEADDGPELPAGRDVHSDLRTSLLAGFDCAPEVADDGVEIALVVDSLDRDRGFVAPVGGDDRLGECFDRHRDVLDVGVVEDVDVRGEIARIAGRGKRVGDGGDTRTPFRDPETFHTPDRLLSIG